MARPVLFPFQVTAVPALASGSETESRRFCVQPAPGSAAKTYCSLFQAFGFSGNGKSWSEHIQAIVEEEKPDLFDHLEFTVEGGLCLIYADSQATVNRLTTLLCPLFADLHKLHKYFSTLDREDFFE